VINILTRTSKRPKFFDGLSDSIAEQTDKDWLWVVHSDNFSEDKDYLKEHLHIDAIVTSEPKLKKLSLYQNKQHAEGIYRCYHAPYNLYLNTLADNVYNGWVMYLDDDDALASPDALKTLHEAIYRADDDTLVLFNAEINGRIKPDAKGVRYILSGNEPPYGSVGGICIAFHSKHLSNDLWDEWSCSDARCIGKLLAKGLKAVYVPTTITKTQQGAGNGNRNDKQ